MSRLRSYAPLARRSEKVRKAAPDFRAVYTEVDRRSEGRCEWGAIMFGPTDFMGRCPKRATDHHHTVKPRRQHHTAELVIALCRGHHERHDWPFARGRAISTALGAGRFQCEILYANPKRTPSNVGRAGGHDHGG